MPLQNKIAQKLDDSLKTSNGLLEIDIKHQKVHEGKMLFISHVFTGVANNGKVYIKHTCGATNWLHSLVTFETTGKWDFKSYSGSVNSGGTVIPILNRRSPNGYVAQTTFTHTPTVTNVGTQRLWKRFGSGTNPSQSSSSAFSDPIESLFGPDVEVLLEWTNLSGATQDISIEFDFYETE